MRAGLRAVSLAARFCVRKLVIVNWGAVQLAAP